MPVPLPMQQKSPPLVECTECARCCTYVAVGINAPTTPRLATDVLWYLYHDSVYVHADADGEWSVVFETRCRNLGDDRRCGIYAVRPHLRGFDPQLREVDAPSAPPSLPRAAQFLAWLEKSPRLFRTIETGLRTGRLQSLARAPRPGDGGGASRGFEPWPKPSRSWES
jgi:hypothetical protein